MKLLCLVALAVCAIAHGANLEDEILPPGISVSKDLDATQYHLNLQSSNAEIQEALPFNTEVKVAGENRLVSGAIEDILEDLRQVIIHGNDDIPPLDPLVIPVLGPYEYREVGVSGEITFRNLRMEGLRWFVADRIDINPLRLTVGMTLTVPWLTVTGSYDARARIALLSHTAGGNFRMFAHRIEVGFDMRMGTNLFGGGHLVLRELDIHIDIHDTHISITGMTGSSILNALISSTIQNVSQDIIQTELENVSAALSEELFDVINEILRGYTISDIFG